ncbi:MAG TPA: alpha-amylase family glycosyl hydrolase, partial [Thermoanaerobaculia bacterium]|nr:alpha-amylase family glycosyl hydrolase [Thermoanaerobaculia bacterium]
MKTTPQPPETLEPVEPVEPVQQMEPVPETLEQSGEPLTAAALSEPGLAGLDELDELAENAEGGETALGVRRERAEPDGLWYKDAIIYEVHVRAFADSDGDGMGDFRGLTARLDYLQDLGVTAIWLLPFYPSPWRD